MFFIAALCLGFVSFSVGAAPTPTPSSALVATDVKIEDVAKPVEHIDTGVPAEDMIPFVATHEWQVVEPYHILPAGLHYQMNLQTGLKMAKLLDQPVGTPTLSEKRKAKLEIMSAHLQEAASMPAASEDGPVVKDLTTQVEKEWKPVKALQSDMDIMQSAVHAVTQATNDAAIMEAILPLEDTVDQLENAKEFAHMGGLPHIAAVLQNPTLSLETRAFAARILGLAAQNHPLVQQTLIYLRVVPTLMSLIASDGPTRDHTRLLFALSSVCRSSPEGAAALLDAAGPAGLAAAAKRSPRMHLRAMTLLTDLIIDEIARTHNTSDIIDRAKDLRSLSHLAAQANMTRAVVAAGWCAMVPASLASDNVDAIEKTLETMVLMMRVCESEFSSEVPVLQALRDQWRTQAASDGEEFSSELAALAAEAEAFLSECLQGRCAG